MAEVSESTETPRNIVDRDKLDDLSKMLLGKVEELVAQGNDLHNAISASRNAEATLPELFKATDDPELVEIRAKVDKANALIAQLTDKAYSKLREGIVTLSDEELNVKDESLKVVRKTISEAMAFFDRVNEASGNEGTVRDYVNLPDYVGKSGSSGGGSKSGNSTGVRRFRVEDITVDGERVGEAGKKSTFTDTVKKFGKLKAETTVEALHADYLAAAGKGKDALAEDIPAIVEFEHKGHKVKVSKPTD